MLLQPLGAQLRLAGHMGNVHAQIVVSVRQRQAVDPLGETVQLKLHPGGSQGAAQSKGVAGVCQMKQGGVSGVTLASGAIS